MQKSNGGAIVARALAREGIRHGFCVPGESYLPLLAALPAAGVEVVSCRHEGTASMAAEAMGRLGGGVPGLCLATRAPGVANAMAGVVVAHLDATPMLLVAGQVPVSARGSMTFQEADLTEMFRPLCKHVEEVHDIAGLEAAVRRACAAARGGTPGPAMLALPEDVLSAPAEGGQGAEGQADTAPAPEVVASLPDEDLRQVARLLRGSARPVVIAGGGPHLWTQGARAMLHDLAADMRLPLVAAFRRQGLVEPSHPSCAGVLGFGAPEALLKAIAQADLLLLLGTRPAGLTLDLLRRVMDVASPPMPVVHVYPDAAMHQRAVRAEVALAAGPGDFLHALRGMMDGDDAGGEYPQEARREEWTRQLHALWREWTDVAPPMPGEVDTARIFIWLRENLPRESVVCSGAGNYALWLHRHFHHHDLFGQLAPAAGSMGYGLPAALAAKLRFPRRPVLAVAGDGCFQMSMQDFATAAQYGLGIIVLVFDNGQFGTIRGHQLRRFPGVDCGTRLVNPDFASLADACGGWGAHVHHTRDFPAAFRAALEQAEKGVPALLHMHVSPRAIAPGVNAE